MRTVGFAEAVPAVLRAGSVTQRYAELADKINGYLQKFREFGIRSNRAVAQYLCVDSAELSRLKNARVGDINLQRGYEILAKCEELRKRLSAFGGPLKTKEVHSVGFTVTALPAVDSGEKTHAIAVQQQSDSVLLTIEPDAQRQELDLLIGDVLRSVISPRRNPYGPMSIMYVLKSVYAAPAATAAQLVRSLRVVGLGRKACVPQAFNPEFDDDIRRRTLAAILNNGGAIALRISKELPARAERMLRVARLLHSESLDSFYFASTMRGALTCANDLRDETWSRQLLTSLVEKQGSNTSTWPPGLRADLQDDGEWTWLKRNRYWGVLPD
ncbi:MAG: hypothetical protein HOP29_18135 [Phycisphaerales bacterium]|nr:hypothetical protein [Phycisphaerales bacterium]